MTRSKWLLSGTLILLVLGFFVSRRWGGPDPLRQEALDAPTPAAQVAATTPPVVPPAPASPELEKFRAGAPVRRLEAFYEAESARVGAIDEHPAETEKRLREAAAELRPEEISWLKGVALDRRRAGDGRFFAVYLVALNAGASAAEALREVALTKEPKEKNRGLAELERQIRAQAIEGLGHARRLAEAQDALLDVIEKQEDEFLRDRAHRSLYEWRTGKKVEEQDKQALKKVLNGRGKAGR